ncbi:meiosis induction protein kinase-like protein [Rhizodiscina lignyota]|uniref:Meiosis induction protein kinase-like protein n=1 Tax=Rhizodiscina lignyota TaxID=1504668 RepID=A0A9P4I4T0_9PEZI|nr:meiosis induction protein kinase-like protein [Rhizodiscina lignyota]
MTVAYDASFRGWPQTSNSGGVALDDKFEVLKEIGDGSFGSVALGRVRSAGAHVARRGTLVAIKTMKKTFESFHQCTELREVIFLRTLPNHPHLVPALDIFLDPFSKKLHIAMEYMDGNLYQLMKARDHKQLDCASVKSILFQIISGLEHIHDHHFFHRDIKPENILVSTSAPQDMGNTFKRYSALVTPPSTPPAYTIKIADFGLARETHSRLPYTTYVSTRWYRAPEVLLRAGEYSAPVDIWAVGAMAVEIATLKPLFPGGNEVDQVWRVCEIMGSPGSWVNKHGAKVGGGEWKDGVRLAQKLGFSFPKMAPHTMDSILQAPHWPASLSDFVTWCLMWDPKNRPTSAQALKHEYFQDAFDPLRPKTSSSRLLSSKKSNLSELQREPSDSVQSLTTKTSSWFRKSLVPRESAAPVVPTQPLPTHTPVPAPSPRPQPVHANTSEQVQTQAQKPRPNNNKRATWANGLPQNAAPIPILPSIRPISPLVSDGVTVQSTARAQKQHHADEQSKKIGRQLSVASNGNHTHYPDLARQEAERALNANSGLASPTSAHKESFFSHLRKRARRFSGRYQTPMSPNQEDLEANAGCNPWVPNGNRQSMLAEQLGMDGKAPQSDFAELDKALQTVRYSLEAQPHQTATIPVRKSSQRLSNRNKSHPPLPGQENTPMVPSNGPISSRTRRAVQQKSHGSQRYETPDEEEELLDEALASVHRAVNNIDRHAAQHNNYSYNQAASYLTPSPSANRNNVGFGQGILQSQTKPLDIAKPRDNANGFAPQWPTPPYEENDWAAAALGGIFAAGSQYR